MTEIFFEKVIRSRTIGIINSKSAVLFFQLRIGVQNSLGPAGLIRVLHGCSMSILNSMTRLLTCHYIGTAAIQASWLNKPTANWLKITCILQN